MKKSWHNAREHFLATAAHSFFYVTVMVRLLNRFFDQGSCVFHFSACMSLAKVFYWVTCLWSRHGKSFSLSCSALGSVPCEAAVFWRPRASSLWPPHSWQEIKTGLLCWRIFLCCYCLSPIALFVLDKSSIDCGLRKEKGGTVSIGPRSCFTDS